MDCTIANEIVSDENLKAQVLPLFEKCNVYTMMIRNQYEMEQDDIKPIVDLLPESTLYTCEDQACLKQKNYRVAKFSFTSYVYDSSLIVAALESKNWYENLKYFYVFLTKGQHLIDTLIALRKCRDLEFIKFVLSEIGTENYEETADHMAMLFIKLRNLDRFICRDNQHFSDLEKYPSFFCDIEIPSFMVDLVKNSFNKIK